MKSSARPTSPESHVVSLHTAAPLGEVGDVLEVGVLAVDAALVIRGWNHWLEAASGRPAEEVCGRPLVAVFPELAGSPAEAAFRSAISGATMMLSHRFHQYLLPLPPPAGYEQYERMQQSARILPLLRDGGHVEGALALIQDVTERVAREEELRNAVERAEEVSTAKSEFLAAMSHDFRTPLSAVIAYAEVMAQGGAGPVTPQHVEFLERIKGGAEHLARMIDEVLAFATVDAGKEQVNVEEFDAVTLAADTTAMLEPEALQKGLELVIVRSRAAPRIRSDPTKVRQILINLLGNALKYTDRGRVTVELAMEKSRVCFRVSDTGPGIAPEDIERVFEPFTRLHTAERRKRGTGLGLAVSRRLARLLGGDLACESALGRGTTFTLCLPVQPVRTRDERRASRASVGT